MCLLKLGREKGPDEADAWAAFPKGSVHGNRQASRAILSPQMPTTGLGGTQGTCEPPYTFLSHTAFLCSGLIPGLITW